MFLCIRSIYSVLCFLLCDVNTGALLYMFSFSVRISSLGLFIDCIPDSIFFHYSHFIFGSITDVKINILHECLENDENRRIGRVEWNEIQPKTRKVLISWNKILIQKRNRNMINDEFLMINKWNSFQLWTWIQECDAMEIIWYFPLCSV